MSVAGDNESEFGGDANFNFWDLKQYNRTVKRFKNGHKLCQDLHKMVAERAEIEKMYVSRLEKWHQDWMKYLDKGPVYGTSRKAWEGFCHEGNDLSKVHSEIRNKLTDDICVEIKKWQKEHYHKANLPTQHLKEVKNLENEFEYTQKPWKIRYEKANTCKISYHNACKQEKSLAVSLNNAKNDSTLGGDQVKKIEDNYKKAEKVVEKTRSAYEAAIQDLDGDSTRYMEEMDKIFMKTQEYEKERIEFFKETFDRIREITNINDPVNNLVKIDSDFKYQISEVDPHADTKNWSVTFGADMVFSVPKFEEYSPELTGISTKNKIRSNGSTSNVVLKSVTTNSHKHSNSDQSYSSKETTTPTPTPTQNGPSSKQLEHKISYDESLNPFGTGDKESTPVESDMSSSQHYETIPADSYGIAVKVKALYSYKKQDDDEISLEAGLIFEKLEDEDEQGWCKGRVNGIVGLYPANYAEPI